MATQQEAAEVWQAYKTAFADDGVKLQGLTAEQLDALDRAGDILEALAAQVEPVEPEREGFGIVQVRYLYPVWVTVDTETRAVTAVNVDDENGIGPDRVKDENGLEGTEAEAQEAYAIAESVEWPAWSFGF